MTLKVVLKQETESWGQMTLDLLGQVYIEVFGLRTLVYPPSEKAQGLKRWQVLKDLRKKSL